MKQIRFSGIGVFLTLAVVACSMGSPSAPAGSTAEPVTLIRATVKPTGSPPSVSPPTNTPVNSLLPVTATPSPVPSATIIPTCPPPDGYTWSHTYLPNSAYIAEILPAGDGNFLLRGRVDNYDGTWLAKMDSDGNLL